MSDDAPGSRAAQVIPWPRPRESAAPPPSEADAQAAREVERAGRRRGLWLRESSIIAAGYLVDGVFLGLFALTGTVHWSAAVLCVLPGWIACAAASVLIAGGHSRHWKDPAVSDAQAFAAMAICGLGIVVYPEMGFLYALTLFTIFLGASYRMSRTRINVALCVMSALIGIATLASGRSLRMPQATVAEQVITWACFTATLSRCVLLSMINRGHQLLLAERDRQVTDALWQIERLTNFDALTGLPNRAHMLRTLEDELARSARDGTALAVALLALDDFKCINDAHGHEAGDRTLRAFAAAVQAHCRDTDTVGRHGGGEFLLVLPASTMDDARQALERLRHGLAGADWNAISPGPTFSAGLAAWQAAETAEQLLSRAEIALQGTSHAGHERFRAG